MAADPGGQQLVRAEPEHVAHRRVELVPVAARGQDGVIGAAAAQRAVGQLGGEGRVTAGQAALGEQGGQEQVGVGVAVGDRAQDVVGGPPGRIGARTCGTGLAGTGLAGTRLVRTGLAEPGGPNRIEPNEEGWTLACAASSAGDGLACHPSRMVAPAGEGRPERRPRAQSEAVIRRLPGAWTSPRRTGREPVPASTA